MGKNNLLSDYQEDCPMFSRFISYLGGLVEEIRGEHGVIVDLGALKGRMATISAILSMNTWRQMIYGVRYKYVPLPHRFLREIRKRLVV